jgi:hypothetical protein
VGKSHQRGLVMAISPETENLPQETIELFLRKGLVIRQYACLFLKQISPYVFRFTGDSFHLYWPELEKMFGPDKILHADVLCDVNGESAAVPFDERLYFYKINYNRPFRWDYFHEFVFFVDEDDAVLFSLKYSDIIDQDIFM